VVNVLDCLPESAQPAARKALAEIRDAEDRAHAEKAIKDFAAAYGATYPRAAAKITDDRTSCWPSTPSRPSTGSTSDQQPS
jgi:putative transposase